MSLTIKGLVVMIIALFVDKGGISINNEAISNAIDVILTISSVVMIYWGRYRQGDINVFGTKKQ